MFVEKPEGKKTQIHEANIKTKAMIVWYVKHIATLNFQWNFYFIAKRSWVNERMNTWSFT